uniref:Putative conserved secreted protein ovary overexpressed n=1 Tax=Rhipicephalus microplus TaxID=6941 RepID=A0A6M2D2M4_RHIMP
MALIRYSRARWRLFWLLTSCVFLYAIFLLSFHIEPASEAFHEFHKCPACFGDAFCPHMHDVKLTGWYSRSLLRFFNVKNVFMGELNGTRVVVKKLAHDDEFREVDRRWCRSRRCNVASAVRSTVDSGQSHEAALMKHLFAVRKEQDMTACPSSRLIRRMLMMLSYSPLMVARRQGASRAADVLAYTVTVNAEPLLLQTFPRMDDWPFPTLLGSCGRTIVETYEGEPLSNFEQASWTVRANISLQLLDMADLMTENPTQYALYMTDVSMDNFAVNDQGEVRLIDLENIIVVDRMQVRAERRPGWKQWLEHREEMCHDCLSFNAEDLCSHSASDHNFYAVCSGMLAPRAFYSSYGGLMHDIPKSVDEQYGLSALLAMCDQPRNSKENRFVASRLLRRALDRVLRATTTTSKDRAL